MRLHSVLIHPIYDEHDVLLLSEGQVITQPFLDHLQARGVSRLHVHREDVPRARAGNPQGQATQTLPAPRGVTCQETNEQTQQLDQDLNTAEKFALPVQSPAFAEQLARRERLDFHPELKSEFVQHQAQSIDKVRSVFSNLLNGQGLDIESLSSITEDALGDLSRDSDLFAVLGLNPFDTDYPSRHCMHVCMLSLSIGTNLGLDKTTLKELAIGSLIHDAGMLKVNPRLAKMPRSLATVEFLEISKHPVRVFDLVRSLEQIPRRSAFIAYQMHERVDGSGYPRGRTGAQIHFLSKVAAVADVYAALVSNRPHRPGLIPHFALESVIGAGNAGVLDAAAVRALIQTTSLYPLGSYVLLSDNRVARTIRSNGTEFDRPVVEAWKIGQLQSEPDVIDLLSDDEIHVIRAIPRLDITEAELTNSGSKFGNSTLLDLLDLAASTYPADGEDKRRSPRKSFRGPVIVLRNASNGDTQNFDVDGFQARNLSRHGVSMIGTNSTLEGVVIAVLQTGTAQPIYMRCRVIRKQQVRGDCWEYGLEFLERISDPVKFKLSSDITQVTEATTP